MSSDTWTKPGPAMWVERLADRPLDPDPVDVAHRVRLDPELADPLALARVERAHADERDARRSTAGSVQRVALEPAVGEPERRGERHPVHVAGRARSRACSGRRARRSRARRRAPCARARPPSVPSATEWSPPSTSGSEPCSSASSTSRATRPHGRLDLRQVARASRPLLGRLRARPSRRRPSRARRSRSRQPLVQPRVADRRRAHVDAAPARRRGRAPRR